jgi:membrane protein YdbS with pleckstrin-like domain
MGNIDKHLLEGERIEYRTALHWCTLAAPGILSTIMFPLALFEIHRAAYSVIVSFMVVLIWFLVRLWVRHTSEFAVTNMRVIIHVGIISLESFDIFLNRISGVEVAQGPFGRIFGAGSLQLVGVGGSTEYFRNIADPWELRREIEKRCTQMR